MRERQRLRGTKRECIIIRSFRLDAKRDEELFALVYFPMRARALVWPSITERLIYTRFFNFVSIRVLYKLI